MAFYAYEVAMEVVALVPPIVEIVKRRSADLADQIERAATSVVLNVCEGNRRTGADRLRMFRIAEGSAAELAGAIEIAKLWGCVIDSAAIEVALRRELSLLYGLTHSKKLGALR